ncbi:MULTISPECIES: hypothetical protein [Bradyrhizobium]|nr:MULTISPECIES: hypothetical protein [unclassified Bradyrhizobium]
MLEDLRAISQPGAMIAVLIILLLMGVADAAIFLATRGWPF